MEIRKERAKKPDHLKGKVTSLRLRPDRLAKYKELGGVKWLNQELDIEINLNKLMESSMNPRIPTKPCIYCGNLTNSIQFVKGICCLGCWKKSYNTSESVNGTA